MGYHIKTYVVKAKLWVFDLFNGSTENYQFRKIPKQTKKENSQAAKKKKIKIMKENSQVKEENSQALK